MKGNLKRTFVLFLVCALILTSGAFHAALAKGGGCPPHPPKTYTVTYSYDDNEPSGAQAPVDNTKYNGELTLTLATPDPVTGYVFLGWQSGVEWSRHGTVYAPGTNLGKVKQNLCFVGKWKIQSYNVSYVYEGAVPPGANALLPTGRNCVGSFEFKSRVCLAPNIWLPGYIFSGWSTSDVPAESIKDRYFIMPANQVVFKGSWTPICDPPRLYPVSFTYADDGNTPAGAQQFATENYGGEKLLTLPTPALVTGYTFIEWRLGETGYQAGANYGEVKGSLAFVGYWRKSETPVTPKPIPIERQNVTYAYTGAVPAGAPAAPELLWYLTPGSVKVKPAPQLAGYVFSGWSTKDATVKDGVFLLSGKNVVFTGSWIAVATPTVEVPKTGGEQAFLLPGALALAGIALLVTALCRRDKKRGK